MYFDLEQRTMGGVARYAAKRWGDRPAIHWEDGAITFAELDRLSDEFARGLIAKGIRKGDRVGIWMHNQPEWAVAWFGISKAGGVVVPLDYWYKPGEVEYILGHSGAAAVVISEPMLKADFPGMLAEIRPRLPELSLVVVKGAAEREGCVLWSDLVEAGKGVPADALETLAQRIAEDDIDFILYTSGTTGRPKGACLSHYNVIRNAWDVGAQMQTDINDNVLVPVPYSHCFGNTLALTMAVLRGASETPMLQYDPKRALEMIDRYGVTMHHGVPTMFIRELHALREGSFSLKTFKKALMAGAPCPIETVKAVQKEMGCDLLIAYGQTEASPVITMTSFGDSDEIKAETVGRPLPGQDVRIVEPGTNNPLPVGVQGELVVRGYNVMHGGYYKQPDQTAEVIRDGWLHTGDLAEVDEFGYFKITGRAKDMVIVGGFNVFPRTIEEHIIAHPKVKEVSVTGIKDPDLGEVVVAAVIPRDGVELDPQEIVDHCYGAMASAAVPRYVAIVDSLPISGRGKVQKFKLQETLSALAAEGRIQKIVPSKVRKG